MVGLVGRGPVLVLLFYSIIINTIKDREKVEASILSAFFYDPSRFDIVLYINPLGRNNYFLGRIIGLPNEVITFKNDGVYINDSLLELPKELREKGIKYVSLYNVLKQEKYKNKTYRMTEDEYFILGDNTYNSRDSREFGAIKRSDIANKIENK